MPSTPSDLLQLAKELVGGTRESEHRAAASRAYYAGYHACSQVAFRQGYRRTNKRSAHRELIDYFMRFVDSDNTRQLAWRQLGRALEQARVVRIEADYELGNSFLQNNSQFAIDLIESAMGNLKKL